MENASKALIIAGGLIVSLIILVILVFEITTFSSTSHEISETERRQEVERFNAQFEKFASKNEKFEIKKEDGTKEYVYAGYLGIKNAISIQDFASLCNLTAEWNKNNPNEKIKITLLGASLNPESGFVSGEDINKVKEYLKRLDDNEKLKNIKNFKIEELFEKLNGPKNEIVLYFFEFAASSNQNNGNGVVGITYSNVTGRVQEINLKLGKIK